MHDDPLSGKTREPGPTSNLALWAMVILFGGLWIALVLLDPTGAARNPYATGPTDRIEEPLRSALLGAGGAIVVVGLLGAVRDALKPNSPPAGPGPDMAAAAPRCPHCNRELAEDHRFCPHCGAPVDEA